ncbi:MAG TPA: hypothetical protein VKT78_12760 [Fimbriimonadaceae bacterium]|nr:hypothetical protein [Fimbriimonadaceae bacterium]
MNVPVRTPKTAERRPVRRHFAFTVKKVKGGYEVGHVIEHPSRGEANRASLSLLGRYGSGEAITLDRELRNGEVLERGALGL